MWIVDAHNCADLRTYVFMYVGMYEYVDTYIRSSRYIRTMYVLIRDVLIEYVEDTYISTSYIL